MNFWFVVIFGMLILKSYSGESDRLKLDILGELCVY